MSSYLENAHLGELLTAALNVNTMLWKGGPAATELEQIAEAWVLHWLSLPVRLFGMILNSASAAVLHDGGSPARVEPQSRAIGPSGNVGNAVRDHADASGNAGCVERKRKHHP